MKYLFVRLSHDYADEFDVSCCYVTTEEEHLAQLELAKKTFRSEHEYYFGTNEALTFYAWSDLEAGIHAVQCSEEFYHEFTKLSAGTGYNVLEAIAEDVDFEEDQDFNYMLGDQHQTE